MAERTHVFDSQKELDEYLLCFLMAFCDNSGILNKDLSEEEVDSVYERVGGLILNVKAYAQEYNELLKEGKIERPFAPAMEEYRARGWKNMDEVRENTLKINKETLEYFGVKPDDIEG